MPVCCLAARRATYGPYRLLLDGPFRPAKNGPSQMRRPAGAASNKSAIAMGVSFRCQVKIREDQAEEIALSYTVAIGDDGGRVVAHE